VETQDWQSDNQERLAFTPCVGRVK
jgi:hypothetical protein